MVEKTVGDVFTNGYYAATDGIKDSFISFAEDIITDIIHRGALEETCTQDFEPWSQLDTSMKAVIGMIVNTTSVLVQLPHFLSSLPQTLLKRASS